ncbi:hypothetical protein NDN11_09300 [Acinetobacter sp. C26M]|uniref:hypothetical protein n=1 Tax=unclassified Acinetobacter TaxID=196816 RepID=UPI002037284A|nr:MULTISPECIES: hypothetical protein [unclassified Acinetobacter]USA44933.1 hypothetical protein NDN11_09300 [Acinetobacter sp. C26M]USA48436.1 hypothetical protein NDN12_09300 [Acinetobacter sp. C26G]
MNNQNFNRKFLVIPIPEEDEFILSFLNRIKIANAYPSLNSVIKTIFKKKISIINIVKGNFDKSVFYEFTDLVEDEINKLCITNNNNFYIVSCLLICPYCIKQQSYVSLNGYRKNVICPTHSIPYITRCPHCNELLDWDAEKIEICRFCKTSVYSNISDYILEYGDKITHSDIFIIYNDFLNLKGLSPSRSEQYSLNNLYKGLRKSIDFLTQPDYFIIKEFRGLFIRTDIRFPNYKTVRYEFFLLVFKVIGFINSTSSVGLKIRESLSNIVGFELVDNITNNYDKEFYNFLSYYNENFGQRRVDLNVKKILNTSDDVSELIINKYFEKYNKNNIIKLEDFIHFCKSLSKNISFEDINDDFIYLHDFFPSKQLELLDKIFYGPTFLYNFNYKEVLMGVKIKKVDLNLVEKNF